MSVADGDKRGAQVLAVYGQLRSEILGGVFDPTRPISQVRLADRLGVSRTPLREALRMLERDGLIRSEPNRRVHVTSLSIDDLEELYALRIVVEGLAVRLTVPCFTGEELEELDYLVVAMDQATVKRDLGDWEVPHRRFHELLVIHGGPRLVRLGVEMGAHGDRYRRVYLEDALAWSLAAEEHRAIATACRNRDGLLAADQFARHLAKTALTIIASSAPAHDSVKIRTALQFIETANKRSISAPSAPTNAGKETHVRTHTS